MDLASYFGYGVSGENLAGWGEESSRISMWRGEGPTNSTNYKNKEEEAKKKEKFYRK